MHNFTREITQNCHIFLHVSRKIAPPKKCMFWCPQNGSRLMPNISPDSKPIHYVCLLDALPQCDLPIFYPAAAILDCWKRMVFWTGQQFTIWICESSKQLVTKDGLSCFAPTLWKSLSTTWAYQHTVTLLIFLVKQEQGKWFTKKTKQNTRTPMRKRKLRENCNTAALSYSSYSTTLHTWLTRF